MVYDTQRTQRKPLGRYQGHARIKPDTRLPLHQRIVIKALVAQCVGHHHHIVLGNGVGTKRNVPAHIGFANAAAGSKEHMVIPHHIHQGNRGIENTGCHGYHRPQAGEFPALIKRILCQSRQALRFAIENGGHRIGFLRGIGGPI